MTIQRAVNPKATLFCFPYAGGNAGIYREWVSFLPPTIDVYAVQLPGRSNRLSEKPLYSMDQLMDQLLPILKQKMDLPVYLLGYSNGCLMAYEVAARLSEHANIRSLIVCSRKPPLWEGEETGLPLRHKLPSAEFLTFLRSLDGMPPEISENQELLTFLLPMLKADFALGETYRAKQNRELNIPVTAICGESDPEATPEEMAKWADFSKGNFSISTLEGGHFLFKDNPTEFAKRIDEVFAEIEVTNVA